MNVPFKKRGIMRWMALLLLPVGCATVPGTTGPDRTVRDLNTEGSIKFGSASRMRGTSCLSGGGSRSIWGLVLPKAFRIVGSLLFVIP